MMIFIQIDVIKLIPPLTKWHFSISIRSMSSLILMDESGSFFNFQSFSINNIEKLYDEFLSRPFQNSMIVFSN